MNVIPKEIMTENILKLESSTVDLRSTKNFRRINKRKTRTKYRIKVKENSKKQSEKMEILYSKEHE